MSALKMYCFHNGLETELNGRWVRVPQQGTNPPFRMTLGLLESDRPNLTSFLDYLRDTDNILPITYVHRDQQIDVRLRLSLSEYRVKENSNITYMVKWPENMKYPATGDQIEKLIKDIARRQIPDRSPMIFNSDLEKNDMWKYSRNSYNDYSALSGMNISRESSSFRFSISMADIIAHKSDIQNALPYYALMERQIGPQEIRMVKVEIALVGIESYCGRSRSTHDQRFVGSKEHFYVPKTECSFCQYDTQVCNYCGLRFRDSEDRYDRHKLLNEHDCYYEAYKTTHMKDYVRPPDTEPVNQNPTSYRHASEHQPSPMDLMRVNAQLMAKQTAESKQKSWEKRTNTSDTRTQAPQKKRANAEELFSRFKKAKSP